MVVHLAADDALRILLSTVCCESERAHSMVHSTHKRLFLLLGITLTWGCSSKLLVARHEEPIVEVRVYRVAEGKMDEWERFFHDKLVEPQEKAGIKVLTAYRTLGDENLFVWSRQFSSKANMPKERAAFYQSDL